LAVRGVQAGVVWPGVYLYKPASSGPYSCGGVLLYLLAPACVLSQMPVRTFQGVSSNIMINGKSSFVLFFVLFSGQWMGCVTEDPRLKFEWRLVDTLGEMKQSKSEVNIILDLKGEQHENFSLERCDELYDCEYCKPVTKEGKLIWKKVPLEIPCKPTRFRVKEVNENLTIESVSLDDLAEDPSYYKPSQPNSDRIILVESKHPNEGEHKNDPSKWKSKQTVEFLPSNCAQEHMCQWTQGRKKGTKTPTGNKCVFEFQKTARYRVSVIAKLGRKETLPSGEIEVNAAEWEYEKDGKEPKRWLRDNLQIQKKNERDCAADPCVLAFEDNATVLKNNINVTDPTAEVSEWKIVAQVLIVIVVLFFLCDIGFFVLWCCGYISINRLYRKCPQDSSDYPSTATSQF